MTPQLLDEIKTVIDRPKFDKLISQGTRCFFWDMVDDVCHNVDITIEAVSPIRDIKDLYLLSLAESVPVDYLISGDKDLTVLKEHAGIPILTYAEFLTVLGDVDSE